MCNAVLIMPYEIHGGLWGTLKTTTHTGEDIKPEIQLPTNCLHQDI